VEVALTATMDPPFRMVLGEDSVHHYMNTSMPEREAHTAVGVRLKALHCKAEARNEMGGPAARHDVVLDC
jgi:hypothetical protein